MRIVFTIAGLEKTSGVSRFCIEVANAMAALHHEVYILCPRLVEYKPYLAVRLVQGTTLADLDVKPDLVHIHALWSLLSVRTMRWCIRNHVPFVVSPHGSLMPRVFTKSPLKKWMFFLLFIWRRLNKAAFIHCTAKSEESAVRRLGFKAEAVIAPLGCTVPAEYKREDRKEVLFLGRIGEEKGLIYLLEAWRNLRANDWRLILAGPDWLGYQKCLERKVEEDGIRGVEFVGNAGEEMKDRLYRAASLFVLPSPSENFSVVVLDALAYGVPVICTQGTPWSVIEDRQCGWWVESNSVASIERALRSAMVLSHDERCAMGARGRVVAAAYSWETVAVKLLRSYEVVRTRI